MFLKKNTENNFNILYNFLDLYSSVIQSSIDSMISNLELLVPKDLTYNNKNITIKKNIATLVLKEKLKKIRQKTNIDNFIKQLLINEQSNIYTYENFLFYFNNDSLVTFCSELCLVTMKYKIENFIGINILSLCVIKDFENLKRYVNKKTNIIKLKFMNKDEKHINVIIKRYLNNINMCFLL